MDDSPSARLLAKCRKKPQLVHIVVLAHRAYRDALSRNAWPR